MEMIKDENMLEKSENLEKSELLASWIGTCAAAFACFAALPIGLRAGWELELTPAALACVLAGSWSLGVAAGGYASLFWKRLQTRLGRAILLIAAAWAAGGLCSVSTGSSFLILLGIVGAISAAIFAAQFRAGPTVKSVGVSTVWALAGALGGLLLAPMLFDRLASFYLLGTPGAWRMTLVASPALLIVAAVFGHEITRPAVERPVKTRPADVSEPLHAMAAAA